MSQRHRIPSPVRLPALLLGVVALVLGAACNGDDETATLGVEETTSTTADGGMDVNAEEVAATLDDLCADTAEAMAALSQLGENMQAADDPAALASRLMEEVGPVIGSLDDIVALEQQDVEGPFQDVLNRIQSGIEMVQEAATAAADGNFGVASDTLGGLDEQAAEIREAAADADLDTCASPRS